MAAALLWGLVSLVPLSCPADADTQLIRIVRGGMAPVAAAVGETVEYRIDYEVLQPAFHRVELDPALDWSPLVIHSYRYLTNAEGKPSFRVMLKVPESLVDTNGTDRWFFFSPRIRVVDTGGNAHTESAPLGVLLVLVRHALRTEGGLTHYQNTAPGSWWLVAPNFWDPSLMDWQTSLRDRSRVLLPPGVELFIAGLDSRIVDLMLRFYGSAPASGFLVFTEGPFELFAWDDCDQTLPEVRTRLIPSVRVGAYFSYQIGPTWALGVRARADARPGDAGKLVAVFLRENGDEWGRRELRLEVAPDPLASMGSITLVNNEGEALHTAHLLGLRSRTSGGYQGTLYAWKQFNQQWSSNRVASYELYRLTSPEPWVDWIPSSYLPAGCPECGVVSGSLICESPNQFYYKLTYAPGTVVATDGYNPFGTDGEHVGSLHLPWSRAESEEVRGSALGPLEIRARFRPPGRIEYRAVRAPVLKSAKTQSLSWGDPCPPDTRSGFSLWHRQIDNSLFLRGTADFGAERLTLTLEEGGVPWIDPRLEIDANLSLAWPTSSDTPDTLVQCVATPFALRLDQLTPTNRPWVELLVQAREEDQPWAAQPVSVEGPGAGQLVLEEPRQTDAYGHYAFYWQPPPADWFEGRTLPYAFDFTVRLPGGRTSTAHVFVSQEVVRGRVVRRHAGADRSDPESDGLSPVSGAEVSFIPSFDPRFTVQTDAEGSFVLPVQGAQLYTLYVRGPQTPPLMTLTESDPILWVPGTQERHLQDPLYLASLSVLPKLRDIYLPPVRQYLQRSPAETWLSLESPTNPAPVIEAFLQRLRSQSRTSSYDEEALRRLHLATWVGYEGIRAAQEVSEFAADQIWEGSCGLVTRLLKEAVKQINVLQIVKGRLNNEIQRLMQSGGDPVRLRKLQDQLSMLEAAERKTLELKRRLNQAAYSLYSQVAVSLAKSGTEPRLVRQLFLQLMLYWNNQLHQLVGEQIEHWLLDSKLGRLASTEVNRRLSSVQDSLEQLDAQLRDALRQYLALGFRRELGRALLEAALAADAGRFPQNAFSYAQADRAVGLAMERLQADLRWFREVTSGEFGYGFWLELLNGVLDDWNNWAKAALTAVTVGTFAGWVKAIDAVLEVVDRMLPVAQIASGLLAAEGIGAKGSLTANTVLGVRFAMSQAGRFRVRVHSPVHLMAVDTLGRRTGRDASGTLYHEIPGALAQAAGPDQPEILFLPDSPATYRLLLFGTGSGGYQVEVGQERTDGTFQTNHVWSGTITPGEVRSAQLTVPGESIHASPERGLPQSARWEIRDENAEGVGHLHLPSGGRVQLRPVLIGADGLPMPISSQDLVWTVSNTNVALLRPTESAWEIQGAAAGNATVQLTGYGLSTNFTVTVTAAPPAVLTLDVSPAVAAPQSVVQLRAHVTDGFNPLGGWTVRFHAPMLSTNPIAAATTGTDGRAEATWSLPPEASGPTLLTATLQRPDGFQLTAGRRLGILVQAGSLPGVPAGSATSISLTEEDAPLARVEIPSNAFPQAVQPVAFLEARSDTDQLPALFGDWSYAKQPVALTFWDAAQDIPLTPERAIAVTLDVTNRALAQTRVWQVRETNGVTTWVPVPNATLGSNGWAVSILQPGVLALLEDARPPELTNAVPAAKATNVSRTAPILLRFHEPIQPGEAWGQWVVQAGTNQVPVAASFQDNTLTLVPQTPWRPATLHVLSLPAGVVIDQVGNPNDMLTLQFTPQPPLRPSLQRPQVEQTPEGRRVRLRFAVEPDLGYVLEARDALSGGTWVPVWAADPPIGTNQVEVTDTVPASIPQRYYRLRVTW